MKNAVRIFLVLAALGGGFYYFREYAPFLAPAPCAEPIRYTLGTFDGQFDISKAYFLSALGDAEAVWEKPYGGELFAYAPADTDADVLKINLIYDYRQQATEKLKELGIVVENSKNSYDALHAKLETLTAAYEKNRTAFEARLAAYEERQETYNRDVARWNDRGGAPPEAYERLETERAALAAEAAALKKDQAETNEEADEINALVAAINRLARALNLTVEKYNTTSASQGESFEEGLYTKNGRARNIYIYEFDDRAELVRVLAHEFGHALTLGHVADPEAIMYEYNLGKKAVLAPADRAALASACGANKH